MIRKFLEYKGDSVKTCAEKWDLSGHVPVPKWEILCPSCSSPTQLIRECAFHLRESAHPYRCAISFKCAECSHVHRYGVLVPKEMLEAVDGGIYTFRQLRRLHGLE